MCYSMYMRRDEDAGPSLPSVALTVLEVERVDLQCAVNNGEHHTELNGVDRMIVRRGQPFTIKLHLRAGSHFQPGSNLKLIATTGSSHTPLRTAGDWRTRPYKCLYSLMYECVGSVTHHVYTQYARLKQ